MFVHSQAKAVGMCSLDDCVALCVLGTASEMAVEARAKYERLYKEYGKKDIFRAGLTENARGVPGRARGAPAGACHWARGQVGAVRSN